MTKAVKLSISVPPELEARLWAAHRASSIGNRSSFIQLLLGRGLAVEEKVKEQINQIAESEAHRHVNATR